VGKVEFAIVTTACVAKVADTTCVAVREFEFIAMSAYRN
jgi:hypothetical protein